MEASLSPTPGALDRFKQFSGNPPWLPQSITVATTRRPPTPKPARILNRSANDRADGTDLDDLVPTGADTGPTWAARASSDDSAVQSRGQTAQWRDGPDRIMECRGGPQPPEPLMGDQVEPCR